MYLGNLSDVDRTIARWYGGLCAVILTALVGTGIYQLFAHESTPSWSRHQLGGEFFRQPVASTGVAEAHAAFADLTGILALFGLAWISARIVFRISRSGAAAIALVIASLITGSFIRFNAIFVDDTVVANTSGYWQFFDGSVDGAINDRYEIGTVAFAGWTLAHILSVPVLLAGIWITLRRAEARRVAAKGQRPAWLDKIKPSDV